MTAALLLDTHIALWLDSGDERLRSASRDMIDGCWRDGGRIYLSAVTAWEIAVLADCQRISLDIPAEEWVERFVARPRVANAPLSCRAACRAYGLRHLEHRDPGDRLLIGTAIELGCPLVTYDQRILRFAERYGREYGFAAVS